MANYDVVVIGSGPGGYVAAIRCAQLDMKVAIIEKYDALGGTCLNVGCIPSKALLDSSEHYHNALTAFPAHGINLKGLEIDLDTMMSRKNEVVSQTCDGVKFLMKKNKIEVLHGHASFISPEEIEINHQEKSTKVKSTRFIIATGSKPASLPGIDIDKKRIITSTEALHLKEVPKHLIIVGGGVIGLELGSVYARLGSKVSVVEFTGSLIGTMDRTLGKELEKSLKNLGFDVYLDHEVKSVSSKAKSVTLKAVSRNGSRDLILTGDYCLMSVGRIPYTEKLGLEHLGVKLDDRGRILVNEHLETSSKGIFAIGDVIKGPMLAHKAEEEGIFVAEYIAGQKPHINYILIPGVVYTWPEVAGVGYTEEQLKELGTKYKSGSFPFKASGRARASMDVDGLVKVLADSGTDEILGVHIIGPRAADMIAEAVVAMEYRASAEDISRMSHAHPTYTEAIKEACLAATGNRAIHI